MAVLTIQELKSLWLDDFIPTQSDYADLFDSLENISQNGSGENAVPNLDDVASQGNFSDVPLISNGLNGFSELGGAYINISSGNVLVQLRTFGGAEGILFRNAAGRRGRIEIPDWTTDNHIFTLPNKSGTFAMLDDLGEGGGSNLTAFRSSFRDSEADPCSTPSAEVVTETVFFHNGTNNYPVANDIVYYDQGGTKPLLAGVYYTDEAPNPSIWYLVGANGQVQSFSCF